MTDDDKEIEHLQGTKDDENEWGDEIRPAQRRRLDAVVSVRFDADELERIRDATPDGNVSNFIRMATLKAAVDGEAMWLLDAGFIASTSFRPKIAMSASWSEATCAAGFVTSDLPRPEVRLSKAT
jgi:hypothetical protein